MCTDDTYLIAFLNPANSAEINAVLPHGQWPISIVDKRNVYEPRWRTGLLIMTRMQLVWYLQTTQKKNKEITDVGTYPTKQK